MAHRHLPVARLEHAVLGHLCAGARRGGNGDERRASLRQGLGAAHYFEEVVEVWHVAAVGEHRGDALAGVDGGTAADGDDGATAVGM